MKVHTNEQLREALNTLQSDLKALVIGFEINYGIVPNVIQSKVELPAFSGGEPKIEHGIKCTITI